MSKDYFHTHLKIEKPRHLLKHTASEDKAADEMYFRFIFLDIYVMSIKLDQ